MVVLQVTMLVVSTAKNKPANPKPELLVFKALFAALMRELVGAHLPLLQEHVL